MRTSFFLSMIFITGLGLAGPALAQDAISQSSPDDMTQTLSDPAPVAKPLYPPAAATGGIAVESPPAASDTRTASVGPSHMLACTALNPCAVSPPLPPLKQQ